MEDKLFPLKKVHSGGGRTTDTGISEVHTQRHSYSRSSAERSKAKCLLELLYTNKAKHLWLSGLLGFTKCAYFTFKVYQIP